MECEWKFAKPDRYEVKKFFNFTNCNFDHPLKEQKVLIYDSKGTRNRLSMLSISSSKSSLVDHMSSLDGDDPLSMFARQEIDPLSKMAVELESTSISNKSKVIDTIDFSSSGESWNSKRAVILNKYTTSDRLTLASSFLGGDTIIKTNQTQTEKVRHRLEQLDDFQDVHYMQNLTQQEYIAKIQQLNAELISAWKIDQRVKSLKIAIQCSKLLTDSSNVIQFYPSKFVLITDILDIFGKLVYDRLKSKSESEKSLPETFLPSMIPEAAKETAMNWFYKVSSIRELLPRLYVEMCLIRCYKFIKPKDIDAALLRLSRMIRGVGDPLVASYARCYLVRIGVQVSNSRDYMKECFLDFLTTYPSIFKTGTRAELLKQSISLSNYLSLYTPALDWLLRNFSSTANDILLEEFLVQCEQQKNNSLILMSVMQSFRPEFVSVKALDFVLILSKTDNEGFTRGTLFRQFGNILSLFPCPVDERLMVLNEAWKTINTITNVDDYVSCVELWAKFVAENFDLEIMNKFLGDILQRIGLKRAFERHYQELLGLVEKIVMNTKDFEGLLTIENFLPLLDLFQKESIKHDVCKCIMFNYKAFCINEDNEVSSVVSDPVVINALMCVAKVLSDGVNALTSDDEQRNVSNLINFFILRVDYGRDFEQQLAFYVNCRSSFPNLDSVLSALIRCVNRLAMNTRTIMNGNHSKRTGAFVKACIAYSFITIPSITSVITRLDLYLITAEIALANLCFGQADACFEAALNLLQEYPKTIEVDNRPRSSEFLFQNYINKFLSLLIVVPDSPEQGVLFNLRLLITKIKEFDFDMNQTTQANIYLSILDALNIYSLEIYPYHLHNVVSNDKLYGADPKFINEINQIATEIVELLLEILKDLNDRPNLQSKIAVDLFEKIITKADLGEDKLCSLALNLWNLSLKHRNQIDKKYHLKIVGHIEQFKTHQKNKLIRSRLETIIAKIQTKLSV